MTLAMTPADAQPDPWLLMNGDLVKTSQASISVMDRSFLYGDGLFETMRIHQGRIIKWPEHCERLLKGMAFLKIKCPTPPTAWLESARRLLDRNLCRNGALRIQVTRGSGPRGLKSGDCGPPLILIQTFPKHDPSESGLAEFRLTTCESVRLAVPNPINGFKTSNRLVYVLAAMEAESKRMDDCLICNTRGEIVESTVGNVFWIEKNRLCTPSLDTGALPGITRQWVLNLADERRVEVEETRRLRTDLDVRSLQAVFLSMSTRGIVKVDELDGIKPTGHALAEELRIAFDKALNQAL